MWVLRKVPILGIVALRKESVDRNVKPYIREKLIAVALRKESVDRNVSPIYQYVPRPSRSPQGERG